MLVNVVLLLVSVSAVGCRLIKHTAELPVRAVGSVTWNKGATNAADPVELQQSLLRVSDELSSRVTTATEALRQDGQPIDPADVLRWKIAFSTEIASIATGANALAGVLDMAVFTTVTRLSWEEHWRPKVFGASAGAVIDAFHAAETNVWTLTAGFLKPEQQSSLRESITLWSQQHPTREDVLALRALGLASQVALAKPAESGQAGSLLGLIDLDPLSSLDPATRELAQTRLFAERALYLTRKMPTMLRWQTELLALNTSRLPAAQQLLANTTQLSGAVDRLTAAAAQLPDQVKTEREAILASLQSQGTQLSLLAGEVREALLAGSQMSTSLNTTFGTFDRLMARFGVGETNSLPKPRDANAEPFRIADYTRAGAQLEATGRQLTELIATVQGMIGSTNLGLLAAQVSPVVSQAQVGTKEIVDFIFWRAVLFVLIVLAAGITYRLVTTRLMHAPRSHTSGDQPL